IRVTSAPARTSSWAAAAASFTLSEPDRNEPGMTRIFNADMISIAFGTSRRPAKARGDQPLRYTQTRAGGRFIQIRSDASVERPGSDLGVGGAPEAVNCTKGDPGAIAAKASRISFSRVSIGLVTSGSPETTADAGALNTSHRESRNA